MTVSSQTAKVSYAGNGSTKTFAVPLYFLADGHLKVALRTADGTETIYALTTNYTVSGAGNPSGGSITLTSGTAAPAVGQTITISRNVPLTQETDYQANDDFPAESHERALDKLTMEVQQLNEILGRSLKLSVTNTMNSTEFTVGPADRVNKVLGFDANGELTVSQELGTYRGNWSAGVAYAQRDLIKDTSTSNIYICLVAHTSSGSQPISTNTDAAKWALIVDAVAADASADAAAASAAAAASSASAAATSAANSASSATASAGSASTASTKAADAASSASAAASSQTAAASSATSAAGSASTATTKASEASSSASAAASSASAASSSASAAASSKTSAETAATNSAASATLANDWATKTSAPVAGGEYSAKYHAQAAASSASSASSSASTATTQASNAATSASEAAVSATSAASSAASAAALLDNFDDRYLGPKASAPTTDNDGNPLVVGALYFDTTTGKMRVYTASGWIDASSASVATLATFEFVATAGQTTFSGNDANGVALSYTVGAVAVTLNGRILRPGDDYTASTGTSVVLTSGAVVNDELQVLAFGNFLVADTYSRSEADATFAKYNSAQTIQVEIPALPSGVSRAGFRGTRSGDGAVFQGYKDVDTGKHGAIIASYTGTTATEQVRVDNSGLMTLAGGQIKFPATQNASSDANTLDDYEEGTWTPNDASGAGLTLSNYSATYTKIGNIVIAQCEFTFPSTTNSSNVRIGGLPYATASTSGVYRGGIGGGFNNKSLTYAVYLINNVSYIQFSLTSGSFVTNNQCSSGLFSFTAIYQTN